MAKMKHAAAFERHGLAVIAGAGTACGDWYVIIVTDLQYLDDLGLVFGGHDEISDHMIKAIFQDR